MNVDRWTGQRATILRAAYRETCPEISDEKFAQDVVGISPGTIYKWQREPNAEPRPGTQQLLKDAFAAAPTAVRERFRALLADVGDPLGVETADSSTRPGNELADLLDQAMRASDVFLAAQPEAVDLDQLNHSAIDLGVMYLASPPRPMLEQGNALRAQLTQRLVSGSYRPQQLADLRVGLARVSGVIAYASLDLGDTRTATASAQATFNLASLAHNDQLQAWARGTQSLIARFDQDFTRAQWYLEDGMRYIGAGTSEIRLLCGLAQVAAHHGNTHRALDLLDRATRMRDSATPDAVEGLFGFSPAKQAYYSGSSLMWLPEKHALKLAAERSATAIAAWEREPFEQRSLDDEALAHVYRATALCRLGDIEAAMDAVAPVLALPDERRISWLDKRVLNLASLIENDTRYSRSRLALAALDRLQSYAART